MEWLDGKPVGASLLFLGSESSGLHGLDVLDEYRGRGIGQALLEHTRQQAHQHGAATMVLLATSDGQRVYERCGFFEVARFGYWYRSFQGAEAFATLLSGLMQQRQRAPKTSE